MKEIIVPTNFIYPDVTPTDRMYSGFDGDILRPDGDWRDYIPQFEDQRVRGIESSACYIEALQHTIATLMEEQFGIKDENFSARFNKLLSGGTEHGGDPVKGAKSIKFDGLIAEGLMSFEGVNSYEEYHSWHGVDKADCIREGKKFLYDWKIDFKIIVEKNLPIETKYKLFRESLKRGPTAISVAAWFEEDEIYVKPEGVRDNHFTEAVFIDDDNCITILDTYAPYIKKLAPNTDFEFALRLSIAQNIHSDRNWIADLLYRLNLFKFGAA